VVASFGSTGVAGMLLLSSHLDRTSEPIHDAIDLRPNEGVVIELRGSIG
jgi:hypothetical protein